MAENKENSYRVIAIKWRPETFEDVVGQSHVTRTLANAILAGRVGHAYLFSGPRGVGKTTTARLLAKALNCPNVKDAVPCNRCDVCKEIRTGSSLDVIEIDAASNRGIDEIRNLRENVKYAPAGGKYKIYVVDEVHMLTDAAFNALLKTLEEPPPHVKFILATTAPLKVPETILSRCQRFEFVRIPTKDVFATLRKISDAERFNVSDEVLMLLSRRANGSLRDAESMLDQLVSAGLAAADEAQVARLMGLSGADPFFAIIDAVRARDARLALQALGELFDKGANLDEFTDGLMGHLRNLLLIRISPELASLVDASSGHVKRYEEQAKQFTEADLLRLVNIASRASLAVRKSVLPRLHLEMAVVEMAYLDSSVELSELLERLATLESGLPGAPGAKPRTAGVRAPSPAAPELEMSAPARPSAAPPHGEEPGTAAPAPEPHAPASTGPSPVAPPGPEGNVPSPGPGTPEATRAEKTAPGPGIPGLAQVEQSWREILTRIETRKKALGVCLLECWLHSMSGNKLVLAFPEDKHFQLSLADSKTNKKIIQEEIAAVMKAQLAVSCISSNVPQQEAPNEVSVFEENDAEKKPADDSLKTIIDYFNGEIIED
jgi:DNA polymerase-3 subunit gamma/tau